MKLNFFLICDPLGPKYVWVCQECNEYYEPLSTYYMMFYHKENYECVSFKSWRSFERAKQDAENKACSIGIDIDNAVEITGSAEYKNVEEFRKAQLKSLLSMDEDMVLARERLNKKLYGKEK